MATNQKARITHTHTTKHTLKDMNLHMVELCCLLRLHIASFAVLCKSTMSYLVCLVVGWVVYFHDHTENLELITQTVLKWKNMRAHVHHMLAPLENHARTHTFITFKRTHTPLENHLRMVYVIISQHSV